MHTDERGRAAHRGQKDNTPDPDKSRHDQTPLFGSVGRVTPILLPDSAGKRLLSSLGFDCDAMLLAVEVNRF